MHCCRSSTYKKQHFCYLMSTTFSQAVAHSLPGMSISISLHLHRKVPHNYNPWCWSCCSSSWWLLPSSFICEKRLFPPPTPWVMWSQSCDPNRHKMLVICFYVNILNALPSCCCCVADVAGVAVAAVVPAVMLAYSHFPSPVREVVFIPSVGVNISIWALISALLSCLRLVKKRKTCSLLFCFFANSLPPENRKWAATAANG